MLTKILLYLVAIGFGVFFGLYMSAGIGWVFVYVFAAAPIFSLIITLIIKYRRRVTLSVDIDKTMLYKRETATLRVTVRNRSFFPIPAIKVKLIAPKGLEQDGSEEYCVLTVSPRSEAVVEVRYKAAVWGVYQVGAENAYLHDFMGFFRFSMPCADGIGEVKVFPDVPEIPGDAPLLRSAAEAAKFSDDNEETKENDGVPRFGGMPGYTHKEYAEGDPIRRINWKLSSKRDKYMVRLDDEIESIQQTIVLDACGGENVLENERAVEGMLAAALGLLKCGFESTVLCRFDGVFTEFEITDPADVASLQTKMAEFRFAEGNYKGERIPLGVLSEKGSSKGILLYTSLFDDRLDGEIDAAMEQGITSAVISSDSSRVGTAYQVWRLCEDHSAELVMA
ncbi:MAG: DUF58 domain-containing protein [Oscillospiraceae bacterium]|nr:DUF58 domain-containing protein [Oscillospiraceae bacterium]